MLCAAAIDGVILRWRRGRWEFPDGAILTAMLVAMVMSAQQPWRYTAITAVVGVVSKYVFRSRAANVFNPAAFALVATFYVFDTGQSGWGALPDASPFGEVVIGVAGVCIAGRVRRMPLVLTCVGGLYGLFTMTAVAGDGSRVADGFRTPDLRAAVVLAVLMVSDPPTSPVKYRDRMI